MYGFSFETVLDPFHGVGNALPVDVLEKAWLKKRDLVLLKWNTSPLPQRLRKT